MAMTNAERQAKWKAKLRAQAASGGNFEAALRAKVTDYLAVLTAEWAQDDDADTYAEIQQKSLAVVAAMTDEDLKEWLERCIFDLYERNAQAVAADLRKRTRQAQRREKDAAKREAKKTAVSN